MKKSTNASGSPGRKRASNRSNLFYGCLAAILFILLILICGISTWLLTGSPTSLFPSSTPSYTPTASSTATITLSPTVTFTPTPSATHTNTPTATATVTPLPTFTASKPPTRTPTITNTPGPTHTPTRTPKPTQTPVITPIVLNNTSYRFGYQGWTGFYNTNAYKNGMRCNSAKGQTFKFTTPAQSQKVAILFYKGPDQGKARVLIDGKMKETIDLYSPTPTFQLERTYENLGNDRHIIKIIVLRSKNPNSTGYSICIDGFLQNSTRFNDWDRNATYGPWMTQNTSALQNTFRVAARKNAYFTFTFEGTTFTWITATGPESGLAEIYVDNKLIRTVDLYTRNPLWQRQIRVGGLSNSTHTVKIVVLGQKNPASNGTKIFLDRITIP